jgi:hypothetical protein
VTISSQIKVTLAALQAWGSATGAVVVPATDPVDFFSILRTGPGKVRAVVLFRGENKRGQYEEAGVVDRVFWVGVSRGQSLQLNKADALISATPAGPAMFDVCEEVRQTIRGIAFDPGTTEVRPDFKSLGPLEVEGWLLDAYTIEFWIGTQLPAPKS